MPHNELWNKDSKKQLQGFIVCFKDSFSYVTASGTLSKARVWDVKFAVLIPTFCFVPPSLGFLLETWVILREQLNASIRDEYGVVYCR